MRIFILAVLCAALTATCRADDEAGSLHTVRVPILNGIYTVEAPSEWHLEISGVDFTATFAEEPDADGTLVISAPNPAVTDIRDYTRVATEALLHAFGGGDITGELEEELDGFPVFTLWFAFSADGIDFLGWARTVDFDGVAVQAMTLATEENFELFMQTAGPIFDSYELDADMVEQNIDLLQDVGRKVLESLSPAGAADPAA